MDTRFPRVTLAFLPTPMSPLERLSRALGGPRIFIKRDDLTGLAGGGNKTRKLEFVLAEALSQGADTIVTVGATQSNHCRQTAAAAARLGLRCVLVLRGVPPAQLSGNLLLDYLLGAEVRFSGERTREEVMDEFVLAERACGRNPYAIPLGASTSLGALAYALAVEELKWQTDLHFDRIIVASSSGGTQAGLIAGAQVFGLRSEILGISVDQPLGSLQEIVAPIARGAIRLLGGSAAIGPAEVSVSADYLGEGYGIMGAPEREAIQLFAAQEGILLDPVYTGRAAAGMIDLIRKGVIGKSESILFWHTGGVPALWAYADGLLEGLPKSP
jgi:D-cysteine desulfhydrase family pyridoxal phosphate-dependent enzyme